MLLTACVISGCQKTEFMPPPQGEPIPYEQPDLDRLEIILKNSPYQLFYQVWKQSNVDSILRSKASYTVLVPDDAAMQAAGFTLTSIANMAGNKADSLVWFYTIPQAISVENLLDNSGNLLAMSMLQKPEWQVEMPYAYQQGSITYRFLHYLAVEEGKLLINGSPIGDAKSAIPASNGYIWPITACLEVPKRDFKDVLESDPRFTMLIELKKRSDEVHDNNYRITYELNAGWDPGPETDFSRSYYNKLNLVMGSSGARPFTYTFNTLFLPTNEAFQQAGFSTVDEILEWNKRGPAMEFDPIYYQVSGGGFPSDTLVAYHFDWGRDNLPNSPEWGKAPDPTPTVFYGNDLRNNLLDDYLINNKVGSMKYVMPYHFGKDAQGRVQLQLKGSEAPPATIIETINTVMGPIHVVDKLLIPKNFKIN